MKEALIPLLVPTLIFFMLSATPFVHAADASDENLQKIKEPLERIYTVVQTLISIVAVLVITFAGFRFMASGKNIQARESAKQMLSYAVMGLLIIWIAPYLANFLTAA